MSSLRDRDEIAEKDDEALALLAQNGCEDASGLLMARCAPMIQQQALRLRSAWLDAEDLAQEGFLGLLAAIRTYRQEGGASFRTYASICIRRRMLTVLRGAGEVRKIPQAEWEELSEGEESVPSFVAGQADPAQLVVQREDVVRLRSRLQEILTDLEYEVLMLYLGAYTYEEIAQRLQLSTKAVDNALQRVRRKLSSASLVEGG